MIRVLISLTVFQICATAHSQIGLQVNSGNHVGGYILYQPNNNTTTFLLDRDGYVVKEWDGEYKPGRAIYLLSSGTLLRTVQLENFDFVNGGRGGRIEAINQEDEVEWYFELSNNNQTFHHDIAYMPNGNILALAWEKMSEEESIENGRNPNLVSTSEIWMEVVLELKPTSLGNAEIVWEWHIKDHLVQDFDATRQNYGTIKDNFRRLNFNYILEDTREDWIHLNAIDYNSELDQIVLGTPFLNEIWIIDHSTTTEEAKTSTGGNSGFGGDFLFRWGNNNAYGIGEANERRLYGQHNPNWILEDNTWKILLFNNGKNREVAYSSIDKIELEYDSDDFSYTMDGNAFIPSEALEVYSAPTKTDFFSSFVSSVQQLSDENYLICEGATGKIFEINMAKEITWEFINPVNLEFMCSNDIQSSGGILFRATHIPASHPGLAGVELTQKYFLEKEGCPLSLESDNFIDFKVNKSLSNTLITFNQDITNLVISTIDGKTISYSKVSNAEIKIMEKLKGIFIIAGITEDQIPFNKKILFQY